MVRTSVRSVFKEHEHRAAFWVFVLSALWLAWVAGRGFWAWLEPPLPPTTQVAQAAPLPIWPLVTPEQMATAWGDASSTLPTDTPLRLRLVGVMESSVAAAARAFIAHRDTNLLENYRIGDLVHGAALLEEVHTDHVILSRGGRQEILRFDEPNTGQPAAAATSAVTPNNSADQMRQALANLAEQAANSPQAALRSMGLRRTSRGYVVSVTAPREMLDRYGMQPGDRIVSINGQAMGADLDADVGIFSQLQQSGSATVEVQRGAQTLTLEQNLTP